MSAEQIQALVAATPASFKNNPFATSQCVALYAIAGTPTVYSVLEPGRNDVLKTQLIAGDGAQVNFPVAEIPLLAGAHDDGGLALTTDDILRVIVVQDGTVLKRVSSGGAPGAGEFTVDPTELIFGTAPGVATPQTDIRVYVLPASDITQQTGGALVTARRYGIEMPDVIVASAEVFLERLVR